MTVRAYRAPLPLLGLRPLSDTLRSVTVSCSRLLDNEVVSTVTDDVHGEITLLVVLSRGPGFVIGAASCKVMLWTMSESNSAVRRHELQVEYESTTTICRGKIIKRILAHTVAFRRRAESSADQVS